MNPMEPNQKERVLENEGVDRISDLPDPILEKILCHLPTKNAVATSILSTRWKNLSPFAVRPIRLELDDKMLLHPTENESNSPSVTFMDFVDKLLNQTLSDVPCLDGMALACDKNYSDAKIVSWVSAALRLKLRMLTLSVSLCDTYVLFDALDSCTTLVRLTLTVDSELWFSEDFSLPNLKCLHLSGLTIKDDGFMFCESMGAFPALEDMCLTNCNMSDLDDLGIAFSRLRKLKMEDCLADNSCCFSLTAPNLEVLELNDYVAFDYSVSVFKSPLAVHINVGPSEDQVKNAHNIHCYDDDGSWRFDSAVATLVIACSNTISLYLAGCSISGLCGSALELPEFQNLTRLSLGCIGGDGWALLARLLQKAPNLEELNFEEVPTENGEGFANFQKSLSVSPVCLDMRMKRIQFSAFIGNEDEIKLAEYFLKNGAILQKLILDFVFPYGRSIFERFAMLPRLSNTCKIVFDCHF